MRRRIVRRLLVALAESAGNERAHAHAGAHAECHQQVLNRERQRDRRQRVLAHLRHKVAVHNVVKRLNQHREHCRQCHRQNQRQHLCRAHAVVCRVLKLYRFFRHKIKLPFFFVNSFANLYAPNAVFRMKRLRRKHGEVRCLKPLVFILPDRYPVQQFQIEPT